MTILRHSFALTVILVVFAVFGTDLLATPAGVDAASGETAVVAANLGESVKSAGSQVVEEGQAFWERILSPVLNRLVGALPNLLKALFVLLFFWVAARILGSFVTKLLSMTDLDNKAVKEWGLEKTLVGTGGSKRSLEKLAGSLTKWFILLFGVIAFLQILNLQMVAGPLQGVLEKILSVVPNLLKGFFILVVYWVVATVVKLALTKALEAVSFDDRAKKYFPKEKIEGKLVGPSLLIGRLFFYVILMFGIPPFLQALGQESLVSPLQDMFGKALGFLPNIFAALIIFIVGYILATIVREIVSNFLAAVGTDLATERLGIQKIIGDRKVSRIAGIIIYFFILIPIIVSSVDALAITAISDPIKDTLEKVLAAIPAVLVATVIIVIGYIVAKAVRGLVESFLSGVGFDQLPEKLGLSFLKAKKSGGSLSSIAGAAVMIVILLLTAQQALDSLGFAQLSSLVNVLVLYLPKLVTGVIILFAALSIGAYIGNLVSSATSGSAHSQLVTMVSKYAIYFFGASMALNQLDVGREIITVAVSAVLGGAALALGLAFGLGGRDKAKEILEKGSKR